jgi:hypothetical protein
MLDLMRNNCSILLYLALVSFLTVMSIREKLGKPDEIKAKG